MTAITLVMCILMIPFNISAQNEQNGDVRESNEYLQCDYDTRKITNYYPLDNSSIKQTWDLFTDEEIAQMALAANTSNGNIGHGIVSPYDIIGDDDRFYSPPISAPYCSVAYLVASFDSNGDGITDYLMETTGFLASKNVLITSAQGVVPKNTSTTTLIELKIYFDLDGTSLAGKSYEHPRRWTWSPNWHDSSISWKYDYCVIELWNNIDRPYYFNCISSSNTSTPQNIYIAGYPKDNKYYQMAAHGQLTYSDYYVCNFNNDMVDGMHGAPIYNNYCIGITTYRSTTYNMGSLFTENLYNLICSKISANP